MIHCAGRAYFPYILYTDHGPVIGLDPRSAPEVEADWLAKSKRCADRRALEHRAHVRADVANMGLLHSRTEGSGDIPGQERQQVTLDEISAPPAEAVDADEVFRLSGLPPEAGPESEGYGYASMVSDEISGIARAGGEVADDFCAGIAPREVRPPGGKRKKRRRS